MGNLDVFGGIHLVVLLRTSLQVERNCSSRPAQRFRAQAWDTICDAQRLDLCRSAVRSRLKRDIKHDRVLAVCLTSPTGATLMRAQRVAFVGLFVQSKEFRDQPCASLLWQAPTWQFFLQSRRYSEVHLGLCQLCILLANVDPCDTQKLRRPCHVANFTCSRSGSAHRKTSEPAPSRLPAEICHSLAQALIAEPHARFSLNEPTLVTSP